MKPFVIPAAILIVAIGLFSLQGMRRSALLASVEELKQAHKSTSSAAARSHQSESPSPTSNPISAVELEAKLFAAKPDCRTRFLTSADWQDIEINIFRFQPADMPRVLDELLRDGEQYLYPPVLLAIFEHWDPADRDAALAKAESLGMHRYTALEGILVTWVEENPDAAFAYASSLPQDRTRSPMIRPVIRAIAATDIDRALELAAGNGIATLNALQVWAATDRGAAIDWLLATERKDLNHYVLLNLIASEASTSPEAALARARSIEDESLRNGALGAVLGRWALLDFESANTELQAILSTQEKQLRLLDEFTDYASGIPPEKLIALAENLPPGVTRDQFISRLSYDLPNPEKAMRLIDLIGHEPTKANAFQAAVRAWADIDLTVASEFLSEMPISPIRDKSIAEFADKLVYNDPEAAITWMMSIADPELKQTKVEHLVSRWNDMDPIAAQAWRAKNTE